MIKAIKKLFWKRRYLKQLEGDAFRKEAMAEYTRAMIDDIKVLEDGYAREKQKKEEEIGALGEGSGKTKYELTQALNEIKKQIEANINSAEKLHTDIRILKSQAEEIWHRREVVKKRF